MTLSIAQRIAQAKLANASKQALPTATAQPTEAQDLAALSKQPTDSKCLAEISFVASTARSTGYASTGLATQQAAQATPLQAAASSLAEISLQPAAPVQPAHRALPTALPTAQAAPVQLTVAERLAMLRAKQKQPNEPVQAVQPVQTAPQQPEQQPAQDAYAAKRAAVQFNAQQQQAISYAADGTSFCLIGAAGSGKTTAVREIVRQTLLRTAALNIGGVELESIALVAFTNRAVNNLRTACEGIAEDNLRKRALQCCSTVHKLLHFAPVYYEVERTNRAGQVVPTSTMRFEPTFRAGNSLDHIRVVVVDEASMLGLGLYKQLTEACHNAIFIFIGDLNQLKPVMDDGTLGYKLSELPVVELTQIYRQAMESPIVRFQHEFTLAGKQLGDATLARLSKESNGVLHFEPIKNPRTPELLARVLANAMLKHMDEGIYIPCKDIILMPNYKNFGTYLVNQWLAQELGRRRHAMVYEVMTTVHPLSGSSKRYFAVGDYVVHNKEEYFVAAIDRNANYSGRTLQEPSMDLNRTGSLNCAASADKGVAMMDFEGLVLDVTQEKDQRDVCSHSLTLIPAMGCASLEAAQERATEAVMVSIRSEVGEIEFAYATTVHKSQGSEWRKVFLALATHARNMLTRELLYVAMTRAREELFVYYSPDSVSGKGDNTVARCIRNQEIKGRTWQEKVLNFTQRSAEYKRFMATPTVYGVFTE